MSLDCGRLVNISRLQRINHCNIQRRVFTSRPSWQEDICSAGLVSVPGRRAVSSLVGPKAATDQVLYKTSLMRLCLVILSPPHPHDTAWSPAALESTWQEVHLPPVGKTSTPNLYLTAVMNSLDLTYPDLTSPDFTCPDLNRPDLTHSDLNRPDLTHTDLIRPDSRQTPFTQYTVSRNPTRNLPDTFLTFSIHLHFFLFIRTIL